MEWTKYEQNLIKLIDYNNRKMLLELERRFYFFLRKKVTLKIFVTILISYIVYIQRLVLQQLHSCRRVFSMCFLGGRGGFCRLVCLANTGLFFTVKKRSLKVLRRNSMQYFSNVFAHTVLFFSGISTPKEYQTGQKIPRTN